MNWNDLNEISQLDFIVEQSNSQPVLIFKHSTRCSISSMAKSRLEREWDDDSLIKPYYLDLISFRNISDEIAHRFNVFHQSPQTLLIKEGKCIYDASHSMISADAINNALKQD